MMKAILFFMSCLAYILADVVLEDIYVKVELYSIDVAAVVRHTIGRCREAGVGHFTLAFFATLAPWLLLQSLSFFLVAARDLKWGFVCVLFSLFGCCFMCSMDAIIGMPRPMASFGGEDEPWLFWLTISVFIASEIFVFVRTRLDP